MHVIPTQTHAEQNPTENKKGSDFFRRVAVRTSYIVGTKWAFLIALLVVLSWLVTGPMFHFTDTWQLVINTGTTIVTFLMVFLIQNTQNREAKATQIKLDELLRAVHSARNALIDIEEAPDERLENLEHEFKNLREVEERKHIPQQRPSHDKS